MMKNKRRIAQFLILSLILISFLSSCSTTSTIEQLVPEEKEDKIRTFSVEPAEVGCGTKDLKIWSFPSRYASEWTTTPGPCQTINIKGQDYVDLHAGNLSSGEYEYTPVMIIKYNLPEDIEISNVISAQVPLELICSIRLVFAEITEFGEIKSIKNYFDPLGNDKTQYSVCSEFTQSREKVIVPLIVHSREVTLFIQPAQHNSITRAIYGNLEVQVQE